MTLTVPLSRKFVYVYVRVNTILLIVLHLEFRVSFNILLARNSRTVARNLAQLRSIPRNGIPIGNPNCIAVAQKVRSFAFTLLLNH